MRIIKARERAVGIPDNDGAPGVSNRPPAGARLRGKSVPPRLRKGQPTLFMEIRKADKSDADAVLAVVNDAAQAYKHVIPADRWQEPYMPAQELAGEIAQGVVFWVAAEAGGIVGVIGLQDKGEVALIRHAYVAPGRQKTGVGTRLLRHVRELTDKPLLVGTWADASWAIDFYRRNGFTVLPRGRGDELLRRYWSVPARQRETSVVLAEEKRTTHS